MFFWEAIKRDFSRKFRGFNGQQGKVTQKKSSEKLKYALFSQIIRKFTIIDDLPDENMRIFSS